MVRGDCATLSTRKTCPTAGGNRSDVAHLFLQQWDALAGEGLEDAVYDRQTNSRTNHSWPHGRFIQQIPNRQHKNLWTEILAAG